MPHCKAFGCSSHDGRMPPNVRLHCFPKEREQCRLWAQNMGIDEDHIETFLDMACSDDQSVRRRVRICTLHFETSCLQTKFKNRFAILNNPRIVLKPHSVPTIFQRNVPMPRWYVKMKQDSKQQQQLNMMQDVRNVFFYYFILLIICNLWKVSLKTSCTFVAVRS